jgi:hypothetical protein
LVEHATENRSVGGSIPPLGTISSPAPRATDLSTVACMRPIPAVCALHNNRFSRTGSAGAAVRDRHANPCSGLFSCCQHAAATYFVRCGMTVGPLPYVF